MLELDPSDYHCLNAALGWLELGNRVEAGAELEKISPEKKDHLEVLEMKWRIAAAGQDWQAALEIARRLLQSDPDDPVGWINQSYSLHELQRTREAWEALLPAAAKFPKTGIIPYNLACYACRLGQREEAERLIRIAVALKGKKQIQRLAEDDPDLEPLRGWIQKL